MPYRKLYSLPCPEQDKLLDTFLAAANAVSEQRLWRDYLAKIQALDLCFREIMPQAEDLTKRILTREMSCFTQRTAMMGPAADWVQGVQTVEQAVQILCKSLQDSADIPAILPSLPRELRENARGFVVYPSSQQSEKLILKNAAQHYNQMADTLQKTIAPVGPSISFGQRVRAFLTQPLFS